MTQKSVFDVSVKFRWSKAKKFFSSPKLHRFTAHLCPVHGRQDLLHVLDIVDITCAFCWPRAAFLSITRIKKRSNKKNLLVAATI